LASQTPPPVQEGRDGRTERKREGCEGEVGKGAYRYRDAPPSLLLRTLFSLLSTICFFLATARCRPVSAAKPKRQQDARFVDTEPRHTEPTNHNNRRYQLVDEGDTDDDDDIDWQDDAVLPPYLLNSAARRKPSPINCRLLLVALVLTSVLLHTVRWRGATARHRTSINESIY